MVKEEREETSSGDSESEEEVNRIDRDRGWPGTCAKAKRRSVRHITTESGEEVRRVKGSNRRRSRRVTIDMGGEEVELYCDTGSNITIITPDMYKKGTGKVVADRSHLRAWGSDKYLDIKGMFKTTMDHRHGQGGGQADSGQVHRTGLHRQGREDEGGAGQAEV